MVSRNFPLEFQKALIGRGTDCAALGRDMHRRGYRISRQFLHYLATGQRKVSGEQLRRICETLHLDEVEKLRLHRAAALDYGFEIGGMA